MVIRQLVSLARREHFYGSLMVKFQDSRPVYTQVVEGRHPRELSPNAVLSVADTTAALRSLFGDGGEC